VRESILRWLRVEREKGLGKLFINSKTMNNIGYDIWVMYLYSISVKE